MNQEADLILRSENIFTAEEDEPFSGYLALKNDRIISTGKGSIPQELIDQNTKILELGNKTVSPGFIDVHCFFTGYVVRFFGMDLSDCISDHQVLSLLKRQIGILSEESPLFGHGLRFSISSDTLNELCPQRPVVLFEKGCETCSMNDEAIRRFNFTPDRCYPEAYVRILPYLLNDQPFIRKQFIDYMKMMNSRGITSIKEMGFDDFCSFTDTLAQMEADDELTLRVNFMSQPVGKDIDFAYGEKMRDKFKGDKVTFSGYNQMTDGSVSEFNAELKQPYRNTDFCCRMKIDWDRLRNDVLESDSRGFRFSLHAQGDKAICNTLDIYKVCKRDENGKMINRHAITDLEFSDPADLERMGKMGVIAEIYPQIQSIANRKDKVAMIDDKIGMERGKYYWNRRKMADSGVIISCGTDLPLLIDDIPESVYHAVGALFPEGGEPFNKENTLTVSELLKAWTIGGAYNLGKENEIGTLTQGKKADIAVLDGDLFAAKIEDVRDLKVCLTICDGKIVYEGEGK